MIEEKNRDGHQGSDHILIQSATGSPSQISIESVLHKVLEVVMCYEGLQIVMQSQPPGLHRILGWGIFQDILHLGKK